MPWPTKKFRKNFMKNKNYKLLKEQFVKKALLKYLDKFGFGDPKKKITDLAKESA